MSSTVKYRRKSIKFRKKKPKKQSRKKKILGGLHTVNQSKIGNCLSHADARCIYRIFKTLANENENLFTDDTKKQNHFHGHQINHKSQYTELFPQFIKINQMLTPSINTKTTPLEILKEILKANRPDTTIINESTFKNATNDLHDKNNIITMMKYKIQNPPPNFDFSQEINISGNTITYNQKIKTNLNDTMLYSIWEKITNEKIQKIQENQKTQETQETQEKQDFKLCKIILTGLEIFPENQSYSITHEQYKEMLKVQTDQKDVYFTLLPILMYSHYIVNNSTFYYNNCKYEVTNLPPKCEFKYDLKDVSTLLKEKDNIIKNKEYFIKANKTYFPNDFIESESESQTNYTEYLEKQIAKYEELMKFIPDDKVIKKWNYNYNNSIGIESIEKYLKDKKEKDNKLFGIFGFSSDMLKKIKNQDSNNNYGHAVAIEKIEKKEQVDNQPIYELTYKNSWGIKYADDGREKIEINKEDMENINKFLDTTTITAWSLEDKNQNDQDNQTQNDQDNQTYAQKIYYYLIKPTNANANTNPV